MLPDEGPVPGCFTRDPGVAVLIGMVGEPDTRSGVQSLYKCCRERERESIHVPVKEALFELLQTFVFLIGRMPTRIDAAARRLVVLLSWLKFIPVFHLRRRCSSFCRLLSF